MGIIKKTMYCCDFCGKETECSDFTEGNNSGYLIVDIKGNRGSRTYDGSWGGNNIKRDYLICYECSDDLLGFIEEYKK